MEQYENEINLINEYVEKEIKEENEKILTLPNFVTQEEQFVYKEIINQFKQSIKYRLNATDVELIWQYCQLKILRDKAWRAYNEKPERYIRIVTGICSDGKTPKVMVKENEHYKTLMEANRQLERILTDLRLTPNARRKK